MLAHQWLSVSGASSEIVNKPRSPLYEGLAVIKLRAHTKKFDKGKNLSTLVEITKPRTRGGGRHCIHGGRKECPDVGFQRRGSGKDACALLAKLVT